MNKIVIAIDGHSSCGKSTTAKRIAKELGYVFIDSGAMYRATTLYALRNDLIKDNKLDADGLISKLDQIKISFQFNPQSLSNETFLNGESVETEIRQLHVSNNVSQVATIKEVRELMVTQQQAMGAQKGIVMDGRDIGTVVFPNAELKIFMTASAKVRATRRYDELKAKGEEVNFDDILENVISRDKIDSTRAVSPLKQADDAILLDNSHMSIDQQVNWILDKIKELGAY